MPSPSPVIIQLLSVFSVAFTAPPFKKAMVLIIGTILAPGRRTVTAALQMIDAGSGSELQQVSRCAELRSLVTLGSESDLAWVDHLILGIIRHALTPGDR